MNLIQSCANTSCQSVVDQAGKKNLAEKSIHVVFSLLVVFHIKHTCNDMVTSIN